MVHQEAVLFNDTITENIKLGVKDVNITQIQVAIRIANADEFIEQMPEGYNTNIMTVV